MKRITSVCLSSTIQRTVAFKNFVVNKVNRSDHYGIWASGKAVNAARVLNQLEKGCVRIVCPLGEENSARFMKLAQKDELEVSPLLISGYTRECWTVLDSNAGTTTELVVAEPASGKMSDEKVQSLIDALKESLSDSEALLVAGSRPDVWPIDTTVQICKAASDEGKILMVDFWGEDLKRTLKAVTPTIIKINEEEFVSTFGGRPGVAGIKETLLTLTKKKDTIYIITRGEKNTIACQNGKIYDADTEKNIKAINTTACGDSFSAGFLYEYLNSGDIKAALEKGTWCASRNAENECPGSIK